MTQENEMNQDVDGFENAPNMVPGEVEAAEQLDPSTGPIRKKGARAKLMFAIAGLLFAGGWGYANQDDFKDALGIQSKGNCSSQAVAGEEAMQGCCPEMMAAMGEEGACQGSCPLAAGENVAAKEGTCCEDGRKKAMIAALLEGTEEKSENDVDSPEEEPLLKEETSEEVATPEQGEAQPKTSEETQSKKEVKSETQPTAAK